MPERSSAYLCFPHSRLMRSISNSLNTQKSSNCYGSYFQVFREMKMSRIYSAQRLSELLTPAELSCYFSSAGAEFVFSRSGFCCEAVLLTLCQERGGRGEAAGGCRRKVLEETRPEHFCFSSQIMSESSNASV